MRDALDDELASVSEQGSGNWFDVRIGRFTSSEMVRLMKAGKRLMTPAELAARPKTGAGSKSTYIEDLSVLADDTQTYISEKVAEVLTGQAKGQVFAHATQWGDEWEPLAAEYFAAKTGYELQIVSFVPVGDHAGGSPDRYVKPVGALDFTELLEIKCPYNPANQVDYLYLTDQYDLKRNYPEHYWQVMANLLFTGKERCNFVTYDPRFIDDKHKMQWLKIEPVNEDFELITKKIAAAVKIKLQMLSTLNK